MVFEQVQFVSGAREGEIKKPRPQKRKKDTGKKPEPEEKDSPEGSDVNLRS